MSSFLNSISAFQKFLWCALIALGVGPDVTPLFHNAIKRHFDKKDTLMKKRHFDEKEYSDKRTLR